MATTYSDDLDKAFANMNRERKAKLALVIVAMFAVVIAAFAFAELSTPYFIQQLGR